MLGAFVPFVWVQGFLGDVVRRRNPFTRSKRYKSSRGMSRIHDWIDWLGGLPFEVASAPAGARRSTSSAASGWRTWASVDGHGCNEFVFSRSGTMPPLPAREPPKPRRRRHRMMTGRVKVFFLVPSLVQGGAERQVLELIARLPERFEPVLALWRDEIYYRDHLPAGQPRYILGTGA